MDERARGPASIEDLIWVDAIASNFERALRAGEAPRIEDFLGDAAGERRDVLARELVTLELEYHAGDAAVAENLRARFPALSEWIGERRVIVKADEKRVGSTGLPELTNYELLSILGQGGMGIVYLGRKRDRVEEHRLAVKMLRGSPSPEDRERFLAEMAALARAHHPHIVPILDSGCEHESTFYFVMPYFPAGDLATVLRAAGPLPEQAAAEYGLALALALKHLHDRGIVHRDLKLRNILLDEHRDGRFPLGRPWLTDFGLVKLLTRHEDAREHGRLMGTVASMSPEQAEGRNDEVGPATDIWSLGVILFELVTGRAPFVGETLDQVRYRIMRHEPPSMRMLRASVPRDLDRIVAKCLEKKPQARFASAQDLIEDLSAFLKHEPLLHATPRKPIERLERWARRKPALALRWGVILALLANIWLNHGAAVFGWSNPPKTDATSWPRAIQHFMEFWFDQVLLLIWGAVSLGLQRWLERDGPAKRLKIAWLCCDTAIVTAILWNVEAAHSPLIVAYAALIVASGLWQDTAVVAMTTAFCVVGYLLLVGVSLATGVGTPLYEVLHVLTTMLALGILVRYFIRRSRTLERLYQHDPTR